MNWRKAVLFSACCALAVTVSAGARAEAAEHPLAQAGTYVLGGGGGVSLSSTASDVWWVTGLKYFVSDQWTTGVNVRVEWTRAQWKTFDEDLKSLGVGGQLGHFVTLSGAIGIWPQLSLGAALIDVTYSRASGGTLGSGVGQNFSLYQPGPLADILRDKTQLEMRVGLFVPIVIVLGQKIFVGAGPYVDFSAAWLLDGTLTASERNAGHDTPAGELSWDLTFGVGTTVGTWF